MMSDLFGIGDVEGHLSVAGLWQDRNAQSRMCEACTLCANRTGFKPTFLKINRGGHFKGRDPTMPIADLEKLWVTGTPILYIGQAGGGTSKRTLRIRIRELLDFGSGKPVGHWGGRALWQMKGAEQFIISWRPLPVEDPRTVKARIIAKFKLRFGKRPFANLKD